VQTKETFHLQNMKFIISNAVVQYNISSDAQSIQFSVIETMGQIAFNVTNRTSRYTAVSLACS